MKNQSSSKSGFITTRNLLGIVLGMTGISLVMLGFAATAATNKRTTKTVASTKSSVGPTAPRPAATSPASGTLTSANVGSANALNYADSVGPAAPNLTFFAGNGTCAAPNSCGTYTLTIDPSVGTASAGYDPTQYSIFIEVSWAQAQEDYDTWMCSGSGNCTQAAVIASNTSTADPEVITLPTTTAAGAYTINVVNTSGAAEPYTGIIYLRKLPVTIGCTGNCTPPRYQNYPAGSGQADNAGEPSIGVDWKPNVAALKHDKVNTGGVAFFTSGPNEWRVNFDDCSSPAINLWEDVSATTTQQFVLSDPIGFVDHYTSAQLGVGSNPPTTGRVFTLDLIGGQGDSLGSFSDNDGNSYTPGGNGGPGQGPDHETLGGGPYNPNSTPPPPPQAVAYGTPPNAIYYCSQNIVAEAQCSRSDNGGQTFGPGVPIFNPSQCSGGIHGHVKVAPDGTVYVPNSSCGTPAGVSGVAVSTDNGLTWTENNVTGSVNGSQDPSVGIGQNNVGRAAGQMTNTIYLGYIDGGHAHVADSHDRGATWEHNTDAGAAFGITHAVFPVVVAGDDNRAAFAFLGTGDPINSGGTCDPYGTANCANIWHLYIATTYDGGANWVTIDATPDDPVQKGVVCLQGTTCAGGRNLLDFNDFSIDAEGRGLVGYADGCVNCNNTFDGQSGANHGTVARQSGGRRLFAHFDPIEPMPPASPQMVSAVPQTGGVLVKWLEPDNGGSPITGYNIYRGTTSGGETFLAHNSGETSTTYLDASAPSPVFYYAQAINAIGEGPHCREVAIGGCVGAACGGPCAAPYKQVDGPGSAGTVPSDPTMGELTIQSINMGEPFVSCTDNTLTIVMKVNTLDPGGTGMPVLPQNSAWQILFGIKDTSNVDHTIYVELDTFSPDTPATPGITIGRRDPCSAGCGTLDTGGTSTALTAIYTKDGTITFKLNLANAINFAAPGAPGVGNAFTWNGSQPGTVLGTNAEKVTGDTILFVGAGAGFLETVQTTTGGTYTRVGNDFCQNLPPVAFMTATPMSGPKNLVVNFDGSAPSKSHEPTGACATINSYTLDFGDGSAPVTNSTGLFTHTYTTPSECFPARLTVKDTAGLTSNTFQLCIAVSSTPPPLTRVVSEKTHGSAGPFDVPLQLDPNTQPRGVECRTGGTAGNHTIIFTFQNNLTSVASANVVSGPGSVVTAGTGIGPAANQYTLNLTGVTDANYVSVALHNALDSAGNLGDVATTMGVLLGDVNSSGRVDAADVSLVRQQTLQTITTSNFRDDLNATGRIDAADVSIARQNTLHTLPTLP